MVKRFSAFILFSLSTGLVHAQDMPPLPPLPDQTVSAGGTASVSASPALPPLPAASAASGSPALPPLPESSSSSSPASPALPPLPASPANNTSSPALPPLPATNAPASNAAPAMPPLPGQPDAAAQPAVSAPADQAQSSATAETPSPASPAETKPTAKKARSERPWEATKWRPNVIFGGWVTPKGGNESSRLAWTSQQVLNALCFKGYKVVKEDGKYDGQADAGGRQWREFTFSVPKSKLQVQVYAKQTGKKIWLRVGPSEPPAFAEAENSIAHVQKMRDADMKALHLIQRKFGRRLSAHRIVRSWEAPYSFNKETVVE